jgi:hypothetical protein
LSPGKLNLTLGTEPLAEKHVALHIDAGSVERTFTGVLERAAGAVQLAPDLGPEQADLTFGTEARSEEHVAPHVDAVGSY